MGPWEWTLLLLLAGLLLVGWSLLQGAPRLTVGRRGILVRETGLGWIHWEEIEGAYSPSVVDTLMLRLRLSERLSRRLRRRNPELRPRPRAGEPFDLRLNLLGAELSPAELLQEIVERGRAPEADSGPVRTADAVDAKRSSRAYQR